MSVHNFKDHEMHPYTDEIKAIPLTRWEDIPDIDDKEKYNWIMMGKDRYGKSMYCTKTGIRRSTTMGEFYGSGIVD
jgi:hypothetical protein